MGMHRLTLQLSQEEFELVSALAGQMKCTNREVFTKALHDKNVDIKPIIEDYWKEKEEKHFRKYFECTLDGFTMTLLKKNGGRIEASDKGYRSCKRSGGSTLENDSQ